MAEDGDFLLSIARFWRAPSWAAELAQALNVSLSRERMILANQQAIKADTQAILTELKKLNKPQLSVNFGTPTDQEK